jgi:hypothetical protein
LLKYLQQIWKNRVNTLVRQRTAPLSFKICFKEENIMKKFYRLQIAAATLMILGAVCFTQAAQLNHTTIQVRVENLSPVNGTWFTPVWIGFHNGGFNTFDVGSPAAEVLERIAEDGNTTPLTEAFANSEAGLVSETIISDPQVPPFSPGESSNMSFILNAEDCYNLYISFAAMLIPSNDAFFGNDDPGAYRIFDEAGNFQGLSITVWGADVLDAGTEVNDEIPEHTAFFGQTVPNSGNTEYGVIHKHSGYQPVLYGGILADPQFQGCDFTKPAYLIARISVYRSDFAVVPDATPYNPPIIIPVEGGSFRTAVGLNNYGGASQSFSLWLNSILPNGSTSSTLFGPVPLYLNAGSATQLVLDLALWQEALPGMHTYFVNIGDYPDGMKSRCSFQVLKQTDNVSPPPQQDDPSILPGANGDRIASRDQNSKITVSPNPFNPTTRLTFALQEAADVRLSVFDVLGREVSVLLHGYRDAGVQEVNFDASALPAGVYFYNLNAGSQRLVGKMLFLK